MISRRCPMCGGPTVLLTDEPATLACPDDRCGWDCPLTPVVELVAAEQQQRTAAA